MILVFPLPELEEDRRRATELPSITTSPRFLFRRLEFLPEDEIDPSIRFLRWTVRSIFGSEAGGDG